jgi:hypothetical protein
MTKNKEHLLLFQNIEEMSGRLVNHAGVMPYFDHNLNLHIAEVVISGVANNSHKFYIRNFCKRDKNGNLVALSRRTELNGTTLGYQFASNENGLIVATSVDKDMNLVAASVGATLTSLYAHIDGELSNF